MTIIASYTHNYHCNFELSDIVAVVYRWYNLLQRAGWPAGWLPGENTGTRENDTMGSDLQERSVFFRNWGNAQRNLRFLVESFGEVTPTFKLVISSGSTNIRDL